MNLCARGALVRARARAGINSVARADRQNRGLVRCSDAIVLCFCMCVKMLNECALLHAERMTWHDDGPICMQTTGRWTQHVRFSREDRVCTHLAAECLACLCVRHRALVLQTCHCEHTGIPTLQQPATRPTFRGVGVVQTNRGEPWSE